MSSKNTKIKDETFEAGLDKLKNIVALLEKTDISLDDALDGFEQGIKLSRKLADKLSQAEARLEQLTKGDEGSLVVAPLKDDKEKEGQDEADEDDDDDDDEDDYDDDDDEVDDEDYE
jgi:exodeoxyribonuclease VII small subunit